MELEEIIFYTLLITAFAFLIVVIFSYLISKSKSKAIKNDKSNFEQYSIKIIKQQRQENQKEYRENQLTEVKKRVVYSNNLKEFQNTSQIVKISTSKNLPLTIEELEERKKNGKGLRYSIVNETVNKVKIKAANFYL